MSATQTRWIIGPRADVLWLMGGTALSAALVATWGALRFDLGLVWLVWIAVSNGPHLVATYARTYLSEESRRVQRRLLLGSLLVFLLGPLVLAVSVAASRLGVASFRAVFLSFQFGVYLWAFWHTVRQHHGILRLYQRKAAEASAADDRLDDLLLHVTLVTAFASYLLRHPDARGTTGLVPSPGLERAALLAMGATAGGVALVWLARQLWRRRANVPKLVFLAVMVPFVVWICTSDTVLAMPIFMIGPLLVVPHDLQYQALVRFYQGNRAPQAREELGVKLYASPLLYGAVALLFGALLAWLGCSLDRALSCGPDLFSAPLPLLPEVHARDLAAVLFHGFFIHHYLVDAYIWHPSRQRWVREGLKV